MKYFLIALLFTVNSAQALEVNTSTLEQTVEVNTCRYNKDSEIIKCPAFIFDGKLTQNVQFSFVGGYSHLKMTYDTETFIVNGDTIDYIVGPVNNPIKLDIKDNCAFNFDLESVILHCDRIDVVDTFGTIDVSKFYTDVNLILDNETGLFNLK